MSTKVTESLSFSISLLALFIDNETNCQNIMIANELLTFYYSDEIKYVVEEKN